MRCSRREVRRGRGSSENQSASVRKHQQCQVKREDEGEEVKQTDAQMKEKADPRKNLQQERVKQNWTQLKERKTEQCVQKLLMQEAARQREQRLSGGEGADDLLRKSALQDQ